MLKYINYLILCSLLLFCCCKGHENINPHTTRNALPETIPLNTDEMKWKLFKNIITNQVIPHLEYCKKEAEKKYGINTDPYTEMLAIKTGLENFMIWISNKPEKQKELANDFTEINNFLENKRKKYAPNISLEQYISDAFNDKNSQNEKYGIYNIKLDHNFYYNTIIYYYTEISDRTYYTSYGGPLNVQQIIFNVIKSHLKPSSEPFQKLIKWNH
ncbi:Mlp family lipoprotein [Borrelia persica]|uniref:Mlp family lipoprotein n=1 Tax=Borrelia persica TaxID=44448 RepID=UPI000463F066|nr:Mlp family lipoprotein [Borrelia persica]